MANIGISLDIYMHSNGNTNYYSRTIPNIEFKIKKILYQNET